MDIQTTDQPEGKQAPFWLWTKWFCPTLLGAFTACWTLLEPFGVSKLIFVDQSWPPWLLTFILSGFIAGTVSATRLAYYYRAIYRYYREHAFVDNVYANRTTIQGKYASLIDGAKQKVTFSGISLHTLLSHPDNREAIIRAACQKRVQFRFLIHHPDCRFIRDRALQEGKAEGQIATDCTTHLKQLVEIQEQCVSDGTHEIEIKTIKDKMPDCFFLEIDDTIFVEPYLLGHTGRDCPVISIKKNNVNGEIFDSFLKKLEHKWKHFGVRYAPTVDRTIQGQQSQKRDQATLL